MKIIAIFLIKLYQRTPLHAHSYCRFIPSCSEYAIIALERFGFIKGSIMAFKRILKCHPKGKSGIDLVKEKTSSKVNKK